MSRVRFPPRPSGERVLPPQPPAHPPSRDIPALRDDPVHAFLLGGAFVSAVLFGLRLWLPGSGTAEAVGQALVPMAGWLGMVALVAVLSVTLVVPLLSASPLVKELVEWGLPLYDEAVTLALSLSGVAALAVLVATGRPGVAFAWFTLQGACAWGCYRLRRRASLA